MDPLLHAFRRVHAQVCVEQEGGWNPDEGEDPPPSAPVTLRAYLPADRSLPRRRARLDTALRLLALIAPLPPLSERLLRPSDWEKAWKEGFHTIKVGRVVVCPPWEPCTPSPGEAVLILEPGLAFGTGHHPTTRLCLAWMQEVLTPGQRILDLGTGSGILTIAAGLLGAGEVVALDTDPQAVRTARSNVRRNRLASRIRVRRGSLPWPEGGKFHGILANISAKVVSALAPSFWDALHPGGWLLASGILLEHREEVGEALMRAGFSTPQERREGEWLAVLALKGTGQGELPAPPAPSGRIPPLGSLG
ncbi:Ribosomal protein L11 methyltransferase [bacterium HR23]|nr:Ribosomal protein L11 methyltransferase [bacterium HR23]